MSYSYLSGPGQPNTKVSTGNRQSIAGCAIGILVLDLRYPLFPGNVANATTWDFPVLYKILEGAGAEIFKADPSILDKVIKAGSELEEQGVRAIIGSCGYFANYQKEAANALDVPVFMSSLLQVPIILGALRPDQKLGIICAFKSGLTPQLFGQVGIKDTSRLAVAGAQDLPEFQNLLNCTGSFNSHELEQELVELAKQFVKQNTEIGAILLECSDMPPYAHAVQEAIRMPVFDFVTLVNWVQNAVVRRPFFGFI
jgi:Asp/Glu/hydantoin racemase